MLLFNLKVAINLQCTETSSSSAMELEGLKRCRKILEDQNVEVQQLTTDRHVSVKSYMKNHWKKVTHYFDTWHLTKGVNLFFRTVRHN